ncbi:MAG: Ig-like domain repeat protein [Gemmataceae bacterium]
MFISLHQSEHSPVKKEARVAVEELENRIDPTAVGLENRIFTFDPWLLAEPNAASNHCLALSAGQQGIAAAAHSGEETVAARTDTKLDSSANPIVFGNSVVFTATVTNRDSQKSPAGAVDFYDGAVFLGSVPLTKTGKRQATAETGAIGGLDYGWHTIEAFYRPEGHFRCSEDRLIQIVKAADTVTIVTSSDSPSWFGEAVTFTATVTNHDSGATPTGRVAFYDGFHWLGTFSLSGSGKSATAATVPISSLSVGYHFIKAVYYPDNPGFEWSWHTITQKVMANARPWVNADVPTVTVNEGESASNTGAFGDPNCDPVTLTASIGVIEQTAAQEGKTAGRWSWHYLTGDGPDQSRTVTITVDDGKGGISETTFYLSVINVAPTLDISGPDRVGANAAYLLTLGAVVDPGQDTVSRYVIHWGDGVDQEVSPAELLPGRQVAHTFPAGSVPGTVWHITVDVQDEDGYYADVARTSVALNHPPLVAGQSLSTDQEVALTLSLTATDEEGDPLTYVLIDAPAHGTLSGAASNLTYTPDPGYSGPDRFTFKVNDGYDDSAPATVNISVKAVLVAAQQGMGAAPVLQRLTPTAGPLFEGPAPLVPVLAGTSSRLDDITAFPALSLSGILYHDLNSDGARAEYEPALPGITVVLETAAEGRFSWAGETVTGAAGEFAFGPLAPGRYRIRLLLPEGLALLGAADNTWAVPRSEGEVYVELGALTRLVAGPLVAPVASPVAAMRDHLFAQWAEKQTASPDAVASLGVGAFFVGALQRQEKPTTVKARGRRRGKKEEEG